MLQEAVTGGDVPIQADVMQLLAFCACPEHHLQWPASDVLALVKAVRSSVETGQREGEYRWPKQSIIQTPISHMVATSNLL